MDRREFLRWIGAGAGTAAAELGLPLRLLAAADPDQNPLAGSVTRDWERIYRDQHRYDGTFDWVWRTGTYRVGLRRGLRGSGERAVALQPGTMVPVGFAVWNGSAGDRDGKKSVTIWQELWLEP